MVMAKMSYEGQLRTKSKHLRSGNEIITDAPVDNHGKGQAFSPTDLVSSALGSCMLTIMGIKADGLGIDLKGTEVEIVKVMAEGPRKIKEIKVKVAFKDDYEGHHKKILEDAARNCPVAKSLSEGLVQSIEFLYP